jgi:hypothetical protein
MPVVMLTAHVYSSVVLDVAGAPAGVEQFPLAVIYLDSAPGVAVRLEHREWAAPFIVITNACYMLAAAVIVIDAHTFPVTTDNHRFQAACDRHGFK